MTKGVLSRGDTPAVLEQAAEAYTDQKHRLLFKIGKPDPAVQPSQTAAPKDNFDDLLAFGRQFGNITVK